MLFWKQSYIYFFPTQWCDNKQGAADKSSLTDLNLFRLFLLFFCLGQCWSFCPSCSLDSMETQTVSDAGNDRKLMHRNVDCRRRELTSFIRFTRRPSWTTTALWTGRSSTGSDRTPLWTRRPARPSTPSTSGISWAPSAGRFGRRWETRARSSVLYVLRLMRALRCTFSNTF